MEENEKIIQVYQKGFNEGYILAQYDPELSDYVSKAKGGGVRFEGMQQGREEYLLEQIKEKLPSWLTERNNSKDIDNLDLGRDVEYEI